METGRERREILIKHNWISASGKVCMNRQTLGQKFFLLQKFIYFGEAVIGKVWMMSKAKLLPRYLGNRKHCLVNVGFDGICRWDCLHVVGGVGGGGCGGENVRERVRLGWIGWEEWELRSTHGVHIHTRCARTRGVCCREWGCHCAQSRSVHTWGVRGKICKPNLPICIGSSTKIHIAHNKLKYIYSVCGMNTQNIVPCKHLKGRFGAVSHPYHFLKSGSTSKTSLPRNYL